MLWDVLLNFAFAFVCAMLVGSLVTKAHLLGWI